MAAENNVGLGDNRGVARVIGARVQGTNFAPPVRAQHSIGLHRPTDYGVIIKYTITIERQFEIK